MSPKLYIRIFVFGSAIILGGVALIKSDLPEFQVDKLKTEIVFREYQSLLQQGKIEPVSFPCIDKNDPSNQFYKDLSEYQRSQLEVNWRKPEYLAAVCLEQHRPELYSRIIKDRQQELEKAAADFYETKSVEGLNKIIITSLSLIAVLGSLLALLWLISQLISEYYKDPKIILMRYYNTLRSLPYFYGQILTSMPCHWGFCLFPVLATIIVTLFPSEEYEYYQLLRVIVCFSAAWVAHCEYKKHASITNFVKLFAATALLYNPIFIVHLSRDIWFGLNLIVVGLFLYYPTKSAGKIISLNKRQKIGVIVALMIVVSLMYSFQHEFCRRCNDDSLIKSLIR